MASPEQIQSLRLLINEPTETVYNDQNLSDVIDQADGDLDLAAAVIWEQKAAGFSTLTDVSESGSSRSSSQIYKNALSMAKYYRDKVTEEEVVEAVQRPRTRTAVRK